MTLQETAAALGLKAAPAVGGLIGGCVALSFVQGLTRLQAVLTVFVGTATASYCQPLVSHLLAWPADLDGGLGFVIGVMGMGLMGWLVKASANPLALWRQLRNPSEDLPP